MLALYFVLTSLTVSIVHGQVAPLNLLVGDLHFVRPKKWSWQAPSASVSIDTMLVAPMASGDTAKTLVMFKEASRGPDTMCHLWKERFPDPANTHAAALVEKIINNRSVTYCEVSGNYAFGDQRYKNHVLIGAVIPSNRKFVHVLLIGPAASVRSAVPDFKKMIEDAIDGVE